MKRRCALCNEETGPEVILVMLPSAGRFWFCSLGCLISWGERRMEEQAERAER